MAGEYTARVLWDFAAFMGWISTVPIFISWHSIRMLKALPRVPRTPDIDARARFWQQDFRYRVAVGLTVIGLSVV